MKLEEKRREIVGELLLKIGDRVTTGKYLGKDTWQIDCHILKPQRHNKKRKIWYISVKDVGTAKFTYGGIIFKPNRTGMSHMIGTKLADLKFRIEGEY